jgi:phosphopantetheinyl transferase
MTFPSPLVEIRDAFDLAVEEALNDDKRVDNLFTERTAFFSLISRKLAVAKAEGAKDERERIRVEDEEGEMK